MSLQAPAPADGDSKNANAGASSTSEAASKPAVAPTHTGSGPAATVGANAAHDTKQTPPPGLQPAATPEPSAKIPAKENSEDNDTKCAVCDCSAFCLIMSAVRT